MQSGVSPQFPFSHVFRWLFISMLISLLAGLPVLNSLLDNPPVYAQDDSTPTPIPHLQRLDYFRPTLREPFQDDMRNYLNAPLYTGNMTITFTERTAVILGDLTVEYTNQQAASLSEIVFRLYPNLPSYGGTMAITYAQVDLIAVSPQLDNTQSVLTLSIPTQVLPNQTIQIYLHFRATVPNTAHLYAQYIYQHDTLALPNFFPLLSIYDENEGWWQNTTHSQGDAVFSETSFFDMTITAPTDWVLITTGVSVNSHLNANQTRTTRYLAGLVRDFAIMGSPDYHTVSGIQNDVGIDVHYLSGGETAAQQSLKYAEDAVQVYTSLFGDYPYTELDIVETHTTAGGIEYPGLIVVASDSWNATDAYLEVVTVHEVAHQWWYSLIGNDQTRYPWLDESLTQYSLGLYYGDVYGVEAQINTFANYEQTWRNSADMPVGLSSADYSSTTYWSIVYNKGPLFFARLSADFGHDIFINALNHYFTTHRYGIVTPADLQASLENSLDTNLDTYFAEWVFE